MSKSEERKQKVAAARAAAKAAAKRERTIRIFGTAAVVLIVVGIISIGVFGSRSGDFDPTKGSVPAEVDQTNFSWTLNPDTTSSDVMEIYEDFQCPGCGGFEAVFADTVKELADTDVVKVVLRPGVFLDNAFSGWHSTRALAAWGCTLKYGEEPAWNFHRLVYSIQPETEGVGWTDEQLIELGLAAGISGADHEEFKACYTNGDHNVWGVKAQEAFDVESTPTVKVNGVTATQEDFASPDAFKTWVLDTIAG